MPIIKLILLIVLVIVVGLGGVYVAENRGLVPSGTFANLINKTKTLPIPTQLANIKVPGPAANFVSTQTANITSGKVASSSGNVLGAFSSVANNVNLQSQEAPLTQRAFEYGRYVYCQQVVNNYQSRNPSPSPSNTPKP